ncbi:MAG: zinc ABC transporter substrate-binding protein [Planctomycetota bacterium]
MRYNSVLGTLFVTLLVGCNAPPREELPIEGLVTDQIMVVATTAMVGDVVKAVGGPHVDVHVLLGPGVDPHLHKTSRDDVAQIMDADLVLYSGLMLEGKMTDTLEQVSKEKPVRAITDVIPEEQLLQGDGQGHHPDPHVWFDVDLWGRTCVAVVEVLSEAMPQQADHFQTNADGFANEVDSMRRYCQDALESIPESQRILITSHDAFGYLGRAYDLEVMGVQGISTDSEAGLRRVNDLVDLIVERQVPAVFIESSVPEKGIRALVDGAAARGHDVRIGGELFSDAAGPGGTYEGTYFGMIDHNVTLIARALGGTAPAAGMRGKLRMDP